MDWHQTSPDGNWEVFIANLDGNSFELYATPIGGGPQIRLNGAITAFAGGNVSSFQISPDSKYVVYRADQRTTAVQELFSVPIGGGTAVRLNPDLEPGAQVYDFEISSDSSRVVFTARQRVVENIDLVTVPIVGGEALPINDAGSTHRNVLKFSISPDGTRVVYSARDAGSKVALFSVPIAGGDAVPLTPDTTVDVYTFTISADSSRVVYVDLGSGRARLMSVPISGGGNVTLDTNLVTDGVETWFRISADSTQVVFLAFSSGELPTALYSTPIGGGRPKALTPPIDVTNFALTPDSTRAVFLAPARQPGTTELLSVPLAGGDSVPLNPVPVAGGDVSPWFTISADSQRVVYVGDIGVDDVLEIYSAPVAGGTPVRLNAALAPGERVGLEFSITPDSQHVAYRVDSKERGNSDAFLVPTAGGHSTPLAPSSPTGTSFRALTPSGDGQWIILETFDRHYKQVQLSSVGLIPAGATAFSPLSPARVFDTRSDEAAPGPKGIVGSGTSIDVQVAGVAGVPLDAVAVALNVTATDSTAPGFVTVWPTGRPRPVASNLNLTAPGQTRPNLVIVGLGTDGRVSLYAHAATHLLADVTGYFTTADDPTSGGRILPLAPARVFDTRADTAAPGPKGLVTAGSTISPTVAGVAGIPADAAAVVLNVTATDASGAGFVTVWPSGLPRPLASTLNLNGPGDTTPNLVIVPVGSDGRISLFTQSGAHLLADVTGYVTSARAVRDVSGLFVPVGPSRLFDTRPGEPGAGPKGFVAAGGTVIAQVTGQASIPDRVGLVAMNVTGTEAPTGFVTAYPGSNRPVASTLNLVGPSDTRANAALTPVDGSGRLTLFSQSGTHLLADANGYTVP